MKKTIERGASKIIRVLTFAPVADAVRSDSSHPRTPNLRRWFEYSGPLVVLNRFAVQSLSSLLSLEFPSLFFRGPSLGRAHASDWLLAYHVNSEFRPR